MMTAHDRRGEQGSTMIIVLVIMVALLGASAVALNLQVSNTKSAGLVRSSRTSLYCAEAGLAAARPILAENYAIWPDLLDLDPDNDPTWYPIQGDIDGDGEFDYEVIIRDNDDEPVTLPPDPTRDNDLRVFIQSKCIANPDTPREILELVIYEGGGTIYRDQTGQGSGNTGNAN